MKEYYLKDLINTCLEENDTNKKIGLWEKINSMLPNEFKFYTPALITRDYMDSILYKIKYDFLNRPEIKNKNI